MSHLHYFYWQHVAFINLADLHEQRRCAKCGVEQIRRVTA